MAFALASSLDPSDKAFLPLYDWVDFFRAARAVLLMLARLCQHEKHRMTLPLKTLRPHLPAEVSVSASCQVWRRNESKGADFSSMIYQCMKFRVGDYVSHPDDHRKQITCIDGLGMKT